MATDTGTPRADYTEGPILRSILNMGLPSMFGFLSQNLYAMADTYWVSKLPEAESAVAAITFFGTLLWLFFSFNQLVGPGSVAIISRRYGERAMDLAEQAIRETLVLKLFFGVVFGGLGFLFTEPLLRLIGAEGEALRLGIEYGQILFAGMAVAYATYSVFTAMRGISNPKLAMVLMIGSNLLNIALDPVFIFGYFGVPAFGIRGAAIASILSFSVTLAIGITLFHTRFTNIRLRVRTGKPMAAASMWRIVRIGIPVWLGEMSYSGARLVLTPLIAAFGTRVVAAYGVGNQITHFGIMILVGIGLGLSALIGHNVGAGKIERARRTGNYAILMGTAIMVCVGALTALLAREIMGIFFDSPETIAVGVIMLRIFALGFPFIGIFLMVEEIHVGVGLNAPAMVFNIVHSWLLQVVPIVVLTQVLGYTEGAVWWIITGSTTITAGLFLLYYRRGRWLMTRV